MVLTKRYIAIYQGFSSQITDLKLLLCVYHLEQADKRKIMQLSPKNGAMKKIIADVYKCQYGSIKEFGLADPSDVNDLDRRLEELKPRWDNLCPGFHEWFLKSRKTTFESNVIESARNNINVQSLFYTIESMHIREKKKQFNMF